MERLHGELTQVFLGFIRIILPRHISIESMFCQRQIYARKYSTLRQDKNLSKISRFSCANVKRIWNLLILSRQR